MAPAAGTGVLLGDGPGASIADRVPMAMITRHGRHVRFAAVLEPVREAPPVVTGVRVTETNGTVKLEVLKGSATDTFLMDKTGRVQAVRGGDDFLLAPFWAIPGDAGSLVYRESALFVKNEAGVAEAGLFYTPSKIEKVESATGETVYREGRDYIVSGGKLVLPEGSAIPFKTRAELYPAPAPGMPSYIRLRGHPETGLLFGEGSVFHTMQTCVTYQHRDAWTGPVPKADAAALPRTRARLKAGTKIVLGVSGDSISAGGNASKFTKAPPFQPAFPELVADGISARFGAEVVLKNRAVGGWTSKSGLADADKLAAEKPDLVIIAYGMNDDLQFDTPVFAANIRGIMGAIRAVNPEAEFILVAGMCGNDDWAPIRPERFPAFRDALKAMAGDGVAVADVTSLWLELMTRKRFLDLTGNGVNHPNDFAHRLYAQVILAVVGD
jgi:lysophospholipase L1-like esterase